MPEWYWIRGLHDAVILATEYCELEYDYRIKKPDRNYLSVKIDSRSAMFDTDITEIRFINAKFSDDIFRYTGYWWVSDELTEGKRFVLSVKVQSVDGEGTLYIEFDRAQVIRR